MLRSLLPFRMRRAQKAHNVLSAPLIEILRPRFLRISLPPAPNRDAAPADEAGASSRQRNPGR